MSEKMSSTTEVSDDVTLTKKERKKVVKLDALKVHYAKKGYLFESLGYRRNDHPPETQSRWIRRLFFTWINPVMRIGNVTPLTQSDLPRLRETESSEYVLKRWDEAWERELKKHQESDGSITPYYDKKLQEYDYYSYKNFSIIRVFANFWSPDIWYSVPIKFTYDVLNYMQPVIMSTQIKWMTRYKAGDWPLWYGYGLTCAFVVVTISMTVLLQQYFYNQTRVSIWSKSAVVQAVYRKSLTIAGASFIGRMDVEGLHYDDTKEGKTDGSAINIVTADATYITTWLPYAHNYWSAPFQIIVAITLLYLNMNWPALLGLPVLLCAIPCTYLISKMMSKFNMKNSHLRDGRIGIVNEYLQSIKVLKMYGWENSVVSTVQKAREPELKMVRRILISSAATSLLWSIVPAMVMAVSFGTYLATQGDLDPATAFTAISLFNMIRFPLVMIPILINSGVQGNNALCRIREYLLAPDLEKVSTFTAPDSIDYSIQCREKNVHIYHYDQRGAIQDVSTDVLSIKKHERVVIVGRVACGKTAFLRAYLGEMRLINSKIDFSHTARPSVEVLKNCMIKSSSCIGIRGSIAYIPQQSWIMCKTIRENILLDKEYDDAKYRKVLKACQLVPELQIMVNGDLTEIGEKGVNLSGGQKQRVNIARAVYQDADIYIFDDILSALDPHVGKSILNDVIFGMLKEKTVIMVTHNHKILHNFDRVVFIDNHSIHYNGPYNHDLRHDPNFISYTAELADIEKEKAEQEAAAAAQAQKNEIETIFSVDDDGIAEDVMVEVPEDQNESDLLDQILKGNDVDILKLLREDVLKEEKVSLQDYKFYFKAYTYWIFTIVVFFQILQAACSFGATWFVSYWTTVLVDRMWLGYTVYLVLMIAASFFAASVPFVNSFGAYRAARKHHNVAFERILGAPMSFFDAVPTGRLMNIFSKEMTSVDVLLPSFMVQAMNMLVQVFGTLVLIVVGIPWFALAFVPITAIYLFILHKFLPPSRQVKRIESQGNAPVITHLSESIDGANCIRAYGLSEPFLLTTAEKVDQSLQSTNALNGLYRWLSSWLGLLGSCIVVLSSLVANITVNSLDGGDVGLALSYAITAAQILSWTVRQCVELENAAVSIERVKQYMELEDQEPPFVVERNRVPPHWPSEGKIEFRNVHMRYKEGLPLVLKGVNIVINPGAKVGVVGRTGAGKSTMFSTLLRLTPICEGSITVDDIDIADIGLHDLRHNISIIPQDPIMFKGSLRYNVDPMGTSSDPEVIDALYKAHLHTLFDTQAGRNLDFQIDEGGKNLSTGQRQLVCVSRAVLRNSRIILLDEATSSVDPETDKLLQQTVREQFSDKTIMTIAHRVNTIMDYDLIVVIDEGIIAEAGNPQDLIRDESSRFHKVAKAMEP